MSFKPIFLSFLIICLLFIHNLFPEEIDRIQLLNETSHWMYQIQGLEEENAIDQMAQSHYPLIVIDPIYTIKGNKKFDIQSALEKLRFLPNGRRRLIIAYIDIGQAEDYRTYWKNDWIAPTDFQKGYPSFLVTIDPDGWSGNYPVAYWSKKWKKIWLQDGIIEDLAQKGFDGVYLDWIESYDDEHVKIRAQAKNKNTTQEMFLFIKKIRQKAQTITPDFLIIAQNVPYLLDENPEEYSSIIDAVSFEDTWYSGEADSDWDSPDGGDIANDNEADDQYSTQNLVTQYQKYLDLGIPVFTVDYCIDPNNADFVYQTSKNLNFRPLVTRVSLSQLTETPPPDLE